MGLYFDCSEHRITDETIDLFVKLAESSGLGEHIDAMFRGDKSHVTEECAALHVALRAAKGRSVHPRVPQARLWDVRDGRDTKRSIRTIHAMMVGNTVLGIEVAAGHNIPSFGYY